MIAPGPSGFTVREIIKYTEADIKSWTDTLEDELTRPTRTFIIEVTAAAAQITFTPGSIVLLHAFTYSRATFKRTQRAM